MAEGNGLGLGTHIGNRKNKQALMWNPPGKRRRGRPRNTWRRSVESEMKKEGQSGMKLEGVPPNRKRWKLIVDGLCSGYE